MNRRQFLKGLCVLASSSLIPGAIEKTAKIITPQYITVTDDHMMDSMRYCMSMNEFSEKFVRPAAQAMADQIDKEIMEKISSWKS